MKYGMIATMILFFGIATSCTQRTCPTYTKGQKEAPQEQVEVAPKDQKRV